ncbi:tetratricopeptide repeat protein [delta proteobacterium NaphS2]|nr:tetratricopeptide repeat protein [delta proteobacterium NaphS2]
MKTTKLHLKMLFFLLAVCLLSACSTGRKIVPQKRPAPMKKAPELGAGNSSGVSPDFSHEVVSDLKHKANEQMRAGDADQAFSTLESALRINPGDPAIWHMLAHLQLKRGNADQAEQLARKSNLLAGKNNNLRRQNWQIIAQALEQKGLAKEAAAARRRAEK